MHASIEERALLPCSEACERNKDPIVEVLRLCLVGHTRVLEIGSGTGQHASYFAAQLPNVLWQPTERTQHLGDLAMRVQQDARPNLLAPALLDVCQPDWPVRSTDAVFTANTLHIMSWSEVECLFRGVAHVLEPGGLLCIYGPFRYAGHYTSPSNAEFDRTLQVRDPRSGIRHFEDVQLLASNTGFALLADHELPAFNRLLVLAQ